jgi:hypothetical protein
MARYNISGLVDETPAFMGERTLPYGSTMFVERNELGGIVFDAAIEAASEDAAVDIIIALVGSPITVMHSEEDEDCGGEADGYRAWGRVLGHIPMGVLRGGVREAICQVLDARGR